MSEVKFHPNIYQLLSLLFLAILISLPPISVSATDLVQPEEIQVDNTPRPTYHNKTCSHDNHCLPSKTYLKCDNGKCHCKIIDWYDSSKDVCKIRTKIGCKPSTPTISYQDCVPHASCKTEDKESFGSCSCWPGYYHDEIENLCVAIPKAGGVYSGAPHNKVGIELIKVAGLSIFLLRYC